jgi:hypothetical protein
LYKTLTSRPSPELPSDGIIYAAYPPFPNVVETLDLLTVVARQGFEWLAAPNTARFSRLRFMCEGGEKRTVMLISG